MVQAIYHVSGIGPTVNGRNGEGEASRRRGAIALARKDILPSRRFERGVRTSYPQYRVLRRVYDSRNREKPPHFLAPLEREMG